MESFRPSLLALLAGVLWVVVFSTLIPAREEKHRSEPRLVNARSVNTASCSEGATLARLPDVNEASGLVVSRRNAGILWTHNDSGAPILYTVGIDGNLRARVQVQGVQIDDWEDIAAGPCPQGSCLYIADIGDNRRERLQVAVYRVPEPTMEETVTRPAEVFYATYPDQPQDAEAFFVNGSGTMFIVTKGEGSPISVYRFPSSPAAGSTVRLEHVITLSSKVEKPQRITDADISWDGRWVVLRTLDLLEFYRASDLLNGKASDPLTFDLSPLHEPQGEGVALAKDGTVYLASEGRDAIRGGTLSRLSCKLPS